MQKTGDPHVDKAIDEIDAAMFSGDVFVRQEARDALKAWLRRWARGCAELQETCGGEDDDV